VGRLLPEAFVPSDGARSAINDYTEMDMRRNIGYYFRWGLLLTSGAVVFQTTGGCLEVIQTGLLAFLAGTTYFLARNV